MEVIGESSKILLGIAYLPKYSVAGLNRLDSILGDITCRYENVAMMGYFNTNLFEPRKSLIMREICGRSNLCYVHNMIPTHFDTRENSVSLIDYFIVSSSTQLKFSG